MPVLASLSNVKASPAISLDLTSLIPHILLLISQANVEHINTVATTT